VGAWDCAAALIDDFYDNGAASHLCVGSAWREGGEDEHDKGDKRADAMHSAAPSIGKVDH